MPHKIEIKIYYEDTDAGGVVYYGNYLRFLERARTEYMIEKGIDVVKWHELGFFFVVAHVDIKYRKSAKLGDKIIVTTETKEKTRATVTFLNKIFRKDELLTEALVTIACINKSGKPTRFPDEFERL